MPASDAIPHRTIALSASHYAERYEAASGRSQVHPLSGFNLRCKHSLTVCRQFKAQQPENAALTAEITMQPKRVIWEGEAPLKLRLTSLGDGGSVLSATNWHGFLDGKRTMRVLEYLATLYRSAQLCGCGHANR